MFKMHGLGGRRKKTTNIQIWNSIVISETCLLNSGKNNSGLK